MDIAHDIRESSSDDDRTQPDSIITELNNVNQRLERQYDALETSSLKLATLAPRIQRLRQHLEQLNMTRLELESQLSDRKVELADETVVKHCVDEITSMFEESTIKEKKSFIKSFVKGVKVKGSEVSLSYIPPLLPGMTSRETYSSSPYCTRWWAVQDLNL